MFKDSIIIFLSTLNDYSNLGLLILAFWSLLYVKKEYFLKRRPFVDIEVLPTLQENDGSWHFMVKLINKGAFPGLAKISEAKLVIGDETYPTVFNTSVVLAPNEDRKIMSIGHINKKGIEKIIGHEYRSNRVSITVKCISKAIGDKDFLYESHYEYDVDVVNDKPVLQVVSESLT